MDRKGDDQTGSRTTRRTKHWCGLKDFVPFSIHHTLNMKFKSIFCKIHYWKLVDYQFEFPNQHFQKKPLCAVTALCKCKKNNIPCDFGSFKVQVEVLTPLQQAIKLRRIWPIGQNIGPKTNGTPMAMKSDMKLKLSLRSDLSEQNTSRSKLVIHSKTPTQKDFLLTRKRFSNFFCMFLKVVQNKNSSA